MTDCETWLGVETRPERPEGWDTVRARDMKQIKYQTEMRRGMGETRNRWDKGQSWDAGWWDKGQTWDACWWDKWQSWDALPPLTVSQQYADTVWLHFQHGRVSRYWWYYYKVFISLGAPSTIDSSSQGLTASQLPPSTAPMTRTSRGVAREKPSQVSTRKTRLAVSKLMLTTKLEKEQVRFENKLRIKDAST